MRVEISVKFRYARPPHLWISDYASASVSMSANSAHRGKKDDTEPVSKRAARLENFLRRVESSFMRVGAMEVENGRVPIARFGERELTNLSQPVHAFHLLAGGRQHNSGPRLAGSPGARNGQVLRSCRPNDGDDPRTRLVRRRHS